MAETDWNAPIIEEFHANQGKLGGPFEGASILLLHHTGAKSGRERTNPLAYQADGDRFLVFASKAGAPTNPDWYHNLKGHPDAKIEVGTETIPVRAKELSGEERDRLWNRQVELMPGFGEYEAKSGRKIPVIALERVTTL
jgi:deazaflavin-dependent oxidoreductase (nitroreductase family)